MTKEQLAVELASEAEALKNFMEAIGVGGQVVLYAAIVIIIAWMIVPEYRSQSDEDIQSIPDIPMPVDFRDAFDMINGGVGVEVLDTTTEDKIEIRCNTPNSLANYEWAMFYMGYTIHVDRRDLTMIITLSS